MGGQAATQPTPSSSKGGEKSAKLMHHHLTHATPKSGKKTKAAAGEPGATPTKLVKINEIIEQMQQQAQQQMLLDAAQKQQAQQQQLVEHKIDFDLSEATATAAAKQPKKSRAKGGGGGEDEAAPVKRRRSSQQQKSAAEQAGEAAAKASTATKRHKKGVYTLFPLLCLTHPFSQKNKSK